MVAKPAKKPRKNGVRVDPEEVVKLSAFQCTMDEIATFFGCAKSTIAERYHAEYDRGREIGKMNIRRKQYQVAMGTPGSLDPISGALIPAVLPSVAMLIWLGKQWLGQQDQSKVELDGGATFIVGPEVAKL